MQLGFELTFQDRPVVPRYAGIRRGPVGLHLRWADPGQWAYPTDRPAYPFLVGDVDARYAEFLGVGVVNAGPGGSPWTAPTDTPCQARELHLRDPGGSVLQCYRPL